MSTLFVHQLLTLPQIIDSRDGCFWCKKGVACECGKMNFYLSKSPFSPVFGLFQQNAVQYAAKWSAFCC